MNGQIGVDLFFVISGFIITVSALRRETLVPALSRASFVEKRFMRIVPLMWIAILAYAALRMVGRAQFDGASSLRALTLAPWGSVAPKTIWTLRQELIFYILFAVTCLGRQRGLTVMVAWFLAPIALLVARGSGAAIIGQAPLEIVLSPANLEFGTGFFAGLVWLRLPRRPSWAPPVHPLFLLAIGTAAAVALAAATPFEWRSVPQSLILAVLGVSLLVFSITVICPAGVLTRTGELLGGASYSIYLFHPHIVSATLGVLAHRLGHHLAVAICIAVLAAIGGGIVLHWFVERPLVRAVQRWIVRRPFATATSVP